MNNRHDSFWIELKDLEIQKKWKLLYEKIEYYLNIYYIFPDIVNELIKYKNEINILIQQESDLKYNEEKSIIFKINNDNYLTEFDFVKKNKPEETNYYFSLIKTKILDDKTPILKKVALYENLIFNKIDFQIKFNKNSTITQQKGSFLQYALFLKKEQEIIENAAKNITVQNIAFQLMVEAWVNYFPYFENIDKLEPISFIQEAKKLLNID